jgi:hypothetical protein
MDCLYLYLYFTIISSYSYAAVDPITSFNYCSFNNSLPGYNQVLPRYYPFLSFLFSHPSFSLLFISLLHSFSTLFSVISSLPFPHFDSPSLHSPLLPFFLSLLLFSLSLLSSLFPRSFQFPTLSSSIK